MITGVRREDGQNDGESTIVPTIPQSVGAHITLRIASNILDMDCWECMTEGTESQNKMKHRSSYTKPSGLAFGVFSIFTPDDI